MSPSESLLDLRCCDAGDTALDILSGKSIAVSTLLSF